MFETPQKVAKVYGAEVVTQKIRDCAKANSRKNSCFGLAALRLVLLLGTPMQIGRSSLIKGRNGFRFEP
jgi:hypothetical protein